MRNVAFNLFLPSVIIIFIEILKMMHLYRSGFKSQMYL